MLNDCATDLDLVIIYSIHDALVIDLFSFKYFSCVCVCYVCDGFQRSILPFNHGWNSGSQLCPAPPLTSSAILVVL